jgi:ABC-type bacteriocin/lantibiotic exporter with double-glycine peptidase domain
MEELERLETERIGVFSIVGVLVFAVVLLWRSNVLLAVLVGIAIGLLASGAFVAKRMTAEHNWAYVEAEARQSGRLVSKGRAWLGNVLPGLVVGLGSLWWLSAT